MQSMTVVYLSCLGALCLLSGCNYEMWRMRKQTVEVNSFHLMKKVEGVGDV